MPPGCGVICQSIAESRLNQRNPKVFWKRRAYNGNSDRPLTVVVLLGATIMN